MAFADHYPLEAFLGIAPLCWWRATDVDTHVSELRRKAREDGAGDEWTAPHEISEARREAQAADDADKPLWEAGKDVFEVALTAHLEDLRAAGRLGATGGLKGREVWQATAWNALVAGAKPDHERKWLAGLIGRVLTTIFVRMDEGRHARRREAPLGHHVIPTRDQAKKAWEKLCSILDAGDSDDVWRTLVIPDCQDQKTGDRCEIHFKGWAATLMRRTSDYGLEPAPDVGPVPLVAATFDVPTGDLLLTDYLRVDGMNEALDFGKDEYGRVYDIGSEEGRARRSAAHAERHRMGYCQTTNTSVTAWRHPETGAIAIVDRWFGREEDEVDGSTPVAGWEKVGDFSCDMWRVTAVDAQVARELTSAEAVDRYLGLRDHEASTEGLTRQQINVLHHDVCYARNVVRVKVRPGRWTMRCGDDFARRMPRHRYGLPKGVKPWCVITPDAEGGRSAAGAR